LLPFFRNDAILDRAQRRMQRKKVESRIVSFFFNIPGVRAIPGVRYHAVSTAAVGHATEMGAPTQAGFLAVKVTGIAVVPVGVAGLLR
jgi:hypothetical protein